jgi:phosphohistidine phosphatase
MKTIYLIRHAKSSWDHTGLRDKDRPLNERGEHDAPLMAKLLKDKGVQPDRLVSSPAKRAFATAVHFATVFHIPKSDITVEGQIYEADIADIMEVVRHLAEEWKTVFIFGHNPTFTDVVNQFTERSIDNVPTCGICKIESTTTNWQQFSPVNTKLTEFYYPKQYFY